LKRLSVILYLVRGSLRVYDIARQLNRKFPPFVPGLRGNTGAGSHVSLISFNVQVIVIRMSKITDKVKEKVKDAKDKVVGAKDVTEKETGYDSTKEYEASEPMSPAKIKEHEPTAVKREMTAKITEGGKRATNPEEAKEIARKSGMAKGTAGAEEGEER